MTKEHKEKIGLANSKIMKEKWQDPEYKKTMRKAQTGHKVSGEFREKCKKRMIGNNYWILGKGNLKHGKSKTSEYRVYYENRRRARRKGSEGSHTIKEWKVLKEKYNFICICCGRQEPEIKLTEDHIIPLSLEGSDYIENIQPLCQSCNSRKNTKIICFTKDD